MSRSTSPIARALMAALAIVLLLSLAVAPVAARDPRVGAASDHAAALPDRIDLPDGFQPEGIESWGGRLFAGSLVDGAIWTGSAVTGEGRILVEGETGDIAVGLHIDRLGRLWVAGGPTGEIRVYRARTGELLQTYTFTGTGFLNDLDIVRGTVYATDSVNQQLAVIPLGVNGSLPDPSAATTMPLTGDLVYQAGFNANGIAASGRWLILVQSNTGLLFRVDPGTGMTRAIDTGGYSVTFGDGLEIRGLTLYVVRNQLNTVAVLRLSRDRLDARLVGELTAADPADLSVPTTATLTLGSLYVVNARFGTPPTPDTDYWITRLPSRP